MSSKARLKLMIFVVALAIGLPMLAIGFTLFSQFIAYFQQGADPASIFRGHTLAIPLEEEAYWRSIEPVGEYTPSNSEREEIIVAYWLAWEAIGRAQTTTDTSDLPTYWAGSAYEQALAGLLQGNVQNQTHSGHTLNLIYFSNDGSVVAFEDTAFKLLQVVAGVPVTLTPTASVVMTLDQGFWRIRTVTLDYDS